MGKSAEDGGSLSPRPSEHAQLWRIGGDRPSGRPLGLFGPDSSTSLLPLKE